MNFGSGAPFLLTVISVFTVFMTVGRLLSGVHWITDIIGGILISTALVLFYTAAVRLDRIMTKTKIG